MLSNTRAFLLLWISLGILLAACDLINPGPTPTPIFVTATPQPQVIIVTNTPTPSPSPVLAATLPVTQSAANTTSTPSPTTAVTLTPTFTVTPTDTPVTPGAFVGPVGGFVASEIGDCTTTPSGGFGTIYLNNEELAAQLGCPLGTAASVNNAYQTYEGGVMVWLETLGPGGPESIYAIFNNGSYQRFNDTWVDGVDPLSVGLAPPPGLQEPIRGFGKVWRESPGVSDGLGWASSGEAGGSGFVQTFERGEMAFVPQNGQTYVFVSGEPGVWTSFAQPF